MNKQITDATKIVIYRLLTILLLLAPLGLSIYFLVWYAQTNANSYGLHIFTTAVMIFFISLEIFILLKNIKKELAIQNIVFNENKKFNTTAGIFVGVGGVIGLGLFITFLVLFCVGNCTEGQTAAYMLILSISFFLLVNCVAYFIYFPFFKEKKFKLEDLLK